MLTLPISHAVLQADIIRPALKLLPEHMRAPHCLPIMGAIAAQETNLRARVQYGNGPAHGLWQFERGGGVVGVLNHHTTADTARELCNAFTVLHTSLAVWRALPLNDHLAACFARLLLWTDARPLPAIDDADGAWAYYIRNWRPGKPHPSRWAAHYAAALEAYTEGEP